MVTTLEQVEFVARSAYRVEVLELLMDHPRDHAELRAATGASNATVHRILAEFREREWVERAGGEYALTVPGRFIAETFDDVLTRVAGAQQLRALSRCLPPAFLDDDLDGLLDAVVTTASPKDPYAAEHRCASILRETTQLRGFDAVVSSPVSFEILRERLAAGLEAEFVLTTDVAERLRAASPSMYRAVRESERFTLWLAPTLPRARLMLFDHRVGIGGYDPRTGVLAVYADTDDHAVRAWAESTVDEQHDRASRPASTDSTA